MQAAHSQQNPLNHKRGARSTRDPAASSARGSSDPRPGHRAFGLMPQRVRAEEEAAEECACWGVEAADLPEQGRSDVRPEEGGRGSGISPGDQWCVAGTGGAEQGGSRGIYSGGWRLRAVRSRRSKRRTAHLPTQVPPDPRRREDCLDRVHKP